MGTIATHTEKTLTIDSEDVLAHYNLGLIYEELRKAEEHILKNAPEDKAAAGRERQYAAKAEEHRKLHARYKPDDNATDVAVRLARQKYPAANHAAEQVVIYDLSEPRP
ncbi:MAG: hypothetical protein ACK4N5_08690 [Myxococcales bacterium]